MFHHLHLRAASLCLVFLSLTALAQVPSAKEPAKKTTASKPDSVTTEVDPVAEQRRNDAVALLIALADEAKSFRDLMRRARVQAQAADALWESDKDRARVLFRNAWDAADEADREAIRRQEEDFRAQLKTSGVALGAGHPNLRQEVLRLAARRDRALGEEFLAKLDESKRNDSDPASITNDSSERNRTNGAPARRSVNSQPSAEIAQRLDLATQLLESGEEERAVQFAEPGLTQVNFQSLEFLTRLRERNAAVADQRFAALMNVVAADPESNANTILILSSYVFTPHLYMAVGSRGGVSSAQRTNLIAPPANFPPNLRSAFLSLATEVLIRPLPPRDQENGMGARAADYFTIARLLPLFDQYAPNLSPLLSTQLASLAADAPENLRSGSNRALTRGLVPDEQSQPKVQDYLDQASRAANSEDRDGAYVNAAIAAVHSGDLNARDIVDKIEDRELRNSVRQYVDYQLLSRAITKKDGQDALRLARSDSLTNLQRAWGYTEAARLLLKSQPSMAMDALNDAAAEARRIGGSDPNRARALLAVATQAFDADRTRAWDLMAEVVKASNSAQDFTGEDAEMVLGIRSKNFGLVSNFAVPGFNVADIFRRLARDDFYRAVELAKSFTSDAPRAASSVAIARTTLEEKPKPPPR